MTQINNDGYNQKWFYSAVSLNFLGITWINAEQINATQYENFHIFRPFSLKALGSKYYRDQLNAVNWVIDLLAD